MGEMSGEKGQPPADRAGDRLELAMRASNEGIWDWWVGEEEIFYTRRIVEFFECGDRAAPNIFLEPHDSVHPRDRARLAKSLALVEEVGGRELLSIDCRVRTGSGAWRWLRIRGAVLRERDGTARRIAGSMIDITQRKEAESQLEEERHLLRLVIDRVPLQVYFKDLNSKFVLANQRMAEWFGIEDPKELVGKHDRDFFDTAHWKEAAADEQRIIESGEPMLGVLEKETWRGREDTWVLTSKFPWHDRHEAVRGTFGVSSDVTGLVLAERESASLAEQLRLRNKAYEEELRLAREIQQALLIGGLPSLPEAEWAGRVRLGARYVPISGLAGDFHEVIQPGPGMAGLLICDVMGHGVRSALVVAMLRGLIEKERSRSSDPGEFLGGLNEGLHAILGRSEVTIFATAFYAVIDLEGGELRCANAGHPGAIAVKADCVEQIAHERGKKGPALGLVQGAGFPTVRMPLEVLRRLFLFTDGLLEAENVEGEAFMEQRLLEVLKESGGRPLEEALDRVLARVLKFSQRGHFDDDVCLLGAEFNPEA